MRRSRSAIGTGILLAVWLLSVGLALAGAAGSITVTPNTGLADSATVSVSGADFGASETVLLYQCKPGVSCDSIGSTATTGGAFGPANVGVLRVFPEGDGDVPTDCGPENSCYVRAIGQTSLTVVDAGISFASLETPAPTCGGKAATIVGTSAGETITGTTGADVIVGRGGNDTINGVAGNDVICGGNGNDTLNGGAGADRLFGENGNDHVNGQSENDSLAGGPGDDALDGGPQTDACASGSGINTETRCES